jgi:hypothetical protein
MVTQVQPGYAHWTLTWRSLGQVSTSVMGFDTDWVGGTDLTSALDLFVGAWLAPGRFLSLSEIVNENAHMIRATGLANIGGALYSKVVDSDENGTTTAYMLPPNVTLKLNKHTARAGRAYRGVVMCPAVNLGAADVDPGGNIDSTILAGLQTRLIATMTDIAVNVGAPMLNHRATIANPHPTPTLVLHTSLNPVVGTDRRRVRQ